MTPSAVKLLAAFQPIVEKHQCGWYLFGAQAVNALGRPRMTADVDVTVDLPDESLEPFIEDMTRGGGFELRVSQAREFVKDTAVLPFVHAETGMPLDIVLARSGLEQMFLERAELVDFGELKVPTISAGDLIVAKILAARVKDVDDAIGVLAENFDTIDKDAVVALLRDIEQAIDQSDLVTTFEEVLKRAQP